MAVVGVTAAIVNTTTSSCDDSPVSKIKHLEVKNGDTVAWARDSNSKKFD